jgi:hypothetical protein
MGAGTFEGVLIETEDDMAKRHRRGAVKGPGHSCQEPCNHAAIELNNPVAALKAAAGGEAQGPYGDAQCSARQRPQIGKDYKK